ncbi:AraC family transcriptional regulator [Vallitalea longa]|uniref:AraC family transcriptional regulator n=1 Tax=Vallitalea longa TaxID=2936439 RepID=A0A9W5YC33_9FIRM|nr:helix-turn-helix domain-containing protein [Vallitalea longa]GKX29786.1 AraC family transcriptional regulator [Vallitalea longa]
MDKYTLIKQEMDFIYFHATSSGSYDIPLHTHDIYEIFLCISDNINYYVEDKVYKLNKYDIVITNDRELHRPFLRNKNKYERKIIQFRPDYLSILNSTYDNPIELFKKRKSAKNNLIKASLTLENNLLYYFMEIDKYYKKHSSELMVKTLLLQLIIKINSIIFDSSKTRNHTKSDPKIVSIQQYINDNLDNNINLDSLSDKFYINKYYLCHLFKENTGITIIEYINIKRIEKAKHLLLEGIPVIGACYLAGFNDYSNFYKKFKKIVGLSPKKFVADYTHISKLP